MVVFCPLPMENQDLGFVIYPGFLLKKTLSDIAVIAILKYINNKYEFKRSYFLTKDKQPTLYFL